MIIILSYLVYQRSISHLGSVVEGLFEPELVAPPLGLEGLDSNTDLLGELISLEPNFEAMSWRMLVHLFLIILSLT